MATRFYFPANTVADVNPAPGAWGYITEATFRHLNKTKGSSAITGGTVIGPWTATAGFTALDRVYVSDPLTAQTISGTVKMQLMVREWAVQDNVDRLQLRLTVVSANGGTLRGTLLALGNYASTAEFVNATSMRNKTGADGDTLSSVVCQAQDRIVVEIGYCCSGACATPEASAKYGENATDLPEDETQTTDGAGWIEFSGNIAFSTDPIIDKQVAASTADGEAYTGNTNYYSYTSASAMTGRFVYENRVARNWALFTGISGLSGATINVAYISCCGYQSDTGTPLSTIFAEDVASPTYPTSVPDYNSRITTTASVYWDQPGFVSGGWLNSPSIVSIIQELANTYDPTAVQILLKGDRSAAGDNYYYLRQWDYSGNVSGPKLHIEFTAGPPTGWNKLAYTSEPPTPNAWNQLKQAAGTGWVQLNYEGE